MTCGDCDEEATCMLEPEGLTAKPLCKDCFEIWSPLLGVSTGS